MHEPRIIRNLLPLIRVHAWGIPSIVVLGLLQSLSEGIGIGLFIPLLDLVVVRPQSRAHGHWLARTMDGLFRNVAPEQ